VSVLKTSFQALIVGLIATFAGAVVFAQDAPQRPIKILVGIAPGGLPDTMARVLAKSLAESLGQPVTVENRPGAGGNLAARAVASAEPDGYTLLLTGNNHAVNPTLLPSPGFDYEADFAPVTMVAEANMLLVASLSLPARNISELVIMAKQQPTIAMAISPIGTPNHLGAELLEQMAGIDLTFVPYTGIGQALPDLMTGRVQLTIGSIPSVQPHVNKGSLKALAVTRPIRSSFAPDVPTAAESGLPGFDVNAWVCLMAPGKTPPAIVQKLNAEVRKALALPDIRESFERQGVEALTMSPDETAAFIKAESQKWAAVLDKAKIRRP
jgi:tripartite-type tricarboxylate transporter receptor subunit TctC